ncbi:hypothetical protein MTO96_020720 [Rhipicephalus appendiculatus]
MWVSKHGWDILAALAEKKTRRLSSPPSTDECSREQLCVAEIPVRAQLDASPSFAAYSVVCSGARRCKRQHASTFLVPQPCGCDSKKKNQSYSSWIRKNYGRFWSLRSFGRKSLTVTLLVIDVIAS